MGLLPDNRAANRLFPSQPLSLKTSVGIASWIFLLLGITTSQATVFMPLIVHVLYGVSLLKAGYITALLSMAWTIMALYSASLLDRWVRVVIVLGPLVILCGAVGLAVSIAHAPLILLGVFVSLIGAGIGVCFAHISSWSIAAARPGRTCRDGFCHPNCPVAGDRLWCSYRRSGGEHGWPGHGYLAHTRCGVYLALRRPQSLTLASSPQPSSQRACTALLAWRIGLQVRQQPAAGCTVYAECQRTVLTR